MTRQHINIHRLHPRQPNKSRSQRLTAVNCTLCTASFPPLPPKQHNFFYVATLLLLIVIFDCCFLWRNLFNPFALRLLFSPLRYSPDNACAAAFLADTPLCTISSLRPNPLLPRAYLAAHLPRFNLFAASIPLGSAGERISRRFRFMWNKGFAVRQNLNVYRAFWLFMHIYASYFMLCTALHCQPCRFATILFRRCRLPLAAKTDLSLRQSLCVSRATGVPVQRFALNSSIDLLFALTADAFCLRRIFAEPPRDRRSLFRLCLLV